MGIPIKRQIEFFNWQLREIDNQRLGYLNTSLQTHFSNRSAFHGVIHGIDESRGNVLVRFERYQTPRLNKPLAGFLYKKANGEKQLNWNDSYRSFREHFAVFHSDFSPIYYLESSNKYSIIGFRDVEQSFIELIKPKLESGNRISILMAEKDPPTEYLENLRNYVYNFRDDKVLNLELEGILDDWVPDLFDNTNKATQVIDALSKNNITIIQGPPGTGKSTLIAEIVGRLLKANNSVCISALANKALTEVSTKNGLQDACKQRKVFKTNLTMHESKENSLLTDAKNGLTAQKGSVLLTTYYKLSSWFNNDNIESIKRSEYVYDYVVIEEASQSFLATISAFIKLGRKILIVGDPMQLSPVVINSNAAVNIHYEMPKYINGLESFVSNFDSPAFFLNETFRLKPKMAELTSLFYKRSLESKNHNGINLNIPESIAHLIPKSGEISVYHMDLIDKGVAPLEATLKILSILEYLVKSNPTKKFAVLAPYTKTINNLQEEASKILKNQENVTIATIDSIQGLTVDYCIFLTSFKSNASFIFQLNRFNVATSRAKEGTLIVTDNNLEHFTGIDPIIFKFLNNANHLN